jgi:hypothetical protein
MVQTLDVLLHKNPKKLTNNCSAQNQSISWSKLAMAVPSNHIWKKIKDEMSCEDGMCMIKNRKWETRQGTTLNEEIPPNTLNG